VKDYDVIVIGAGINGLTVASYLQKAGLSVGVFEARGQCGAFCDTVELGQSGFLHNTHASWIVPAMSPAMADLELERYGLDLRGCDVLFAKPFRDQTNTLLALDSTWTQSSVARHSEHDAAVVAKIGAYQAEHGGEALEINRQMVFGAPTVDLADRVARFNDGLMRALDAPLSGDDIGRMTGFEILETLFESEHVKTLPGALGEFTGQWPLNRRVGPTVIGLAGFNPMAVHTAKGGSHALTHSLVKCFVAHGGEIWTTCPVEKILLEKGRAVGIRLSEDALIPGEEIRANTVVSNLTLVPTFLRLLGEEAIGAEWARRIKYFNYDDPQLLGVYWPRLHPYHSGRGGHRRGALTDDGWLVQLHPSRSHPGAPGLPHRVRLDERSPATASLEKQTPEGLECLAPGTGRGPGRRDNRPIRGVRAGLQGSDHRAAHQYADGSGELQPLGDPREYDRGQRDPGAIRRESTLARSGSERSVTQLRARPLSLELNPSLWRDTSRERLPGCGRGGRRPWLSRPRLVGRSAL